MSALLEQPEQPPFIIERPARQTCAVVFSSPHSGRHYSSEFLAVSRLDPRALRRSEDSFVDELFGFAPTLGAPLIAATFPRAYCDANRERWELDPEMFADALPSYCNVTSRRVAAGFGTIARLVSSGETIYREKLRFKEARARIASCWEPYHEALWLLIEDTTARFGGCLLIDCHSMPEDAPRFREQARFVLGDAHGASCSPEIVELVERRLQAAGHVVRRNDPYAGGYVTRFYGRPRSGVHVLQLEIARRLYMDERRNEKRPSFDVLRAELIGLAETVIAHLSERPEILNTR